MMKVLIFCIALLIPCSAQQPAVPDLAAQRAAMKKLEFLIGKWSGEAHISRGSAEPLVLTQTEDAQFKLDGLILVIEGVGTSKADGKRALQAFGVVSYDDRSGAYRMRAFNDGRFLESEVKLSDNGNGMTWGFALGQIQMNSAMRIDEKGDWTELHQIKIGTQAPRKYMEVSVSRQK